MIDKIQSSNYDLTTKAILIYCYRHQTITHSSQSLSVALRIPPSTVRAKIKSALKPKGVFKHTANGTDDHGNVYPQYTFSEIRLKETIDSIPPQKKMAIHGLPAKKAKLACNSHPACNKRNNNNSSSNNSNSYNNSIKSTSLVTSEATTVIKTVVPSTVYAAETMPPSFDWTSFNDGFFKESKEYKRIQEMPNTKRKVKDLDELPPDELDRILNM